MNVVHAIIPMNAFPLQLFLYGEMSENPNKFNLIYTYRIMSINIILMSHIRCAGEHINLPLTYLCPDSIFVKF